MVLRKGFLRPEGHWNLFILEVIVFVGPRFEPG